MAGKRPERSDNHLLDCLVGSAVAASMLGAVLEGHAADGQTADGSDVFDIDYAFEDYGTWANLP